MDRTEVQAALARCTLKASRAADGRGVAGAVREARNGLQHAGLAADEAGRLAEAAGRLGLRLGHSARVAAGLMVARLTGAPL